jgi:prepilin-type N-terminal cleavage/methylation domain-containing protein
MRRRAIDAKPDRRASRHGRADGFTLIEVTVALSLIAILLAVLYPRMSRFAAVYRLEGAARNLAATLQKTRLRAIAEGRCYEVTFDGTAKTYLVRSWRGVTPCGAFSAGADQKTGVAQKIDDADVIGLSATADPIFTPRGATTVQTVVTLTNRDGNNRLVAANPVGRIDVR